MDVFVNGILPLLVIVFLVATLVANPILTTAKGVFDKVIYERPTPSKTKTVVHFKDGQICILQGEINIPFAPGADITIIQCKDGKTVFKENGIQEKVAA